MATAVYVLCALTSIACAVLLARSYDRTRAPLLLWSALCFAFLALNNVLLVADLAVWTSIDLRIARQASALIGVTLLLYGFIAERPGARADDGRVPRRSDVLRLRDGVALLLPVLA